MIYLELFWAFFQIGALSFGGGYGMISLLSETVSAHGWLSEAEFLQLVAVSEATPGPIAINMATFIGSTQAGIGGALAATLGAITPSFALVLLIAAFLNDLLQRAGVRAFLSGVRPCVVGLIVGTAVTLFLSTLLGVGSGGLQPDLVGIAIFLFIAVLSTVWKKWRHSTPSPIVLILLSAVAGIAAGVLTNV